MREPSPAPVRTISEARCHGGVMGFHAHASDALGGLEARFGLCRPPSAERCRW